VTNAVFPFIDVKSLRFEAPELLWLLSVPIGLLALWGWQLTRRRADARRLRRRLKLPLSERFHLFGGLPLWLCVVLATASAIVAIARPYARVSLLRTAGVDLVILQDTSASMYVRDVSGNRWQRSMRFVRLLGEALSWQDDRVALAVFAHMAAPQVRLTKDPNTFFFFLDHLQTAPTFRLEDDTTWDTNIESGIHWGLRLIEKDEELHGPSPNARIFVLVSDGQAWSGDVKEALAEARQRGVPMYVVGVGTAGGGLIPEPARPAVTPPTGPPEPSVYSTIDRSSLNAIASAGGGDYFELDRESDREIASTIINAARRRAGTRGVEERTDPLYWRFLVISAGFLFVGILFVRERAELWIHMVGAAIVLLIVSNVLR
jgi:Ca-activated chloride channel family protein